MFALISCGVSKKSISKKKTTHLEKNLTKDSDKFEPITFNNIIISSKVNLQINQQFLTFDLTSRMDFGSKILLSGNIFLPIFKILIQSEKVFGYDRINREYFETSIVELNDRFNLNLGLNEIQNILIGNPLFPLDKIRNYKKSMVKEGILFEYNTKGFNGSFLFDNSMKKLIRQSIIHKDSQSSILLSYLGKFLNNDDDIPSIIRARVKYGNNLINLNIKNRSRYLNKEFKFTYKVPKGYSIIKIWKIFTLKYC